MGQIEVLSCGRQIRLSDRGREFVLERRGLSPEAVSARARGGAGLPEGGAGVYQGSGPDGAWYEFFISSGAGGEATLPTAAVVRARIGEQSVGFVGRFQGETAAGREDPRHCCEVEAWMADARMLRDLYGDEEILRRAEKEEWPAKYGDVCH